MSADTATVGNYACDDCGARFAIILVADASDSDIGPCEECGSDEFTLTDTDTVTREEWEG